MGRKGGWYGESQRHSAARKKGSAGGSSAAARQVRADTDFGGLGDSSPRARAAAQPQIDWERAKKELSPEEYQKFRKKHGPK